MAVALTLSRKPKLSSSRSEWLTALETIASRTPAASTQGLAIGFYVAVERG